jgi:hypothetical protein
MIDAATITPTVVTNQRKTKCRMADGRRTPPRCATIALQNPLARLRHGVFGLKTFTNQTKVPRKSKTSVEPNTAAEAVAPSTNGKTAAEPKKKSRATAATAKKKKSAAPRKSATKQPTASGQKPASEPTDDQIRLRAYFLAERRHKLSLPGDSNHDWIEARRQLIEEAQRQS